MSVPMPSRIYQILGAACLFLVAGSGLYMWKERWPRSLQAYQRESLLLFALTIVFVLIAYLYYNLTFVQHQGRYLFPALLPLGLWAAIGISGWLSLLPKAIGPVPLRWLAVPFVGLLALLSWYALTHYIVGVLPNWN
jgi:hypothetical protein